MPTIHDYLKNPQNVKNLFKLFPNEENMFLGNDLRIAGLSGEAAPKNEYVLDSFKHDHMPDCAFYLVKIPSTESIALLRVCDAMEGSGYKQFCVVREVSENAAENESIKIIFNRWKSRC